MKKIVIAFLLVLFVAGCKKNSGIDTRREKVTGLEGKWIAQESVETSFEGGIEVEKKVKNTFTEKDYIVFNYDGTAVSSYEGHGLQHSVYDVSAKTLVLAAADNPNEKTEFEIKIWTGSDLVIARELIEVIKNVRYTTSVEISFKKN
ncbi:MAG TPA: membrane lipoprotein lipid attachment site-containing protein [Pedobacter sp.]|nr:membrane lipoprotein lipid attachment site-containing protein [Pedobacter sp.]